MDFIVILSVTTKLLLLVLLFLSIWSISIILQKHKALSRLRSKESVDAWINTNFATFTTPHDFTTRLHALAPMHAEILGKLPLSANANSNEVRALFQSERSQLDPGLATLATLGANAPFIGLLGTVLGIIQAFQSLSQSTAGSSSSVMSAISEALIATAVGLLVAIPATIAFNIFTKTIKRYMTELDTLLALRASIVEKNK